MIQKSSDLIGAIPRKKGRISGHGVRIQAGSGVIGAQLDSFDCRQRNSGTIPWPLSRPSRWGCIIQNCPASSIRQQMFNACRGTWPPLTSTRHSMLIPHPRGVQTVNRASRTHGPRVVKRHCACAMILGKFDSPPMPSARSIFIRRFRANSNWRILMDREEDVDDS